MQQQQQQRQHRLHGKEVRLCRKNLIFGSDKLQEMLDSSPLYQKGDWEGLRNRFQKDGYLLIRGLIPADVSE
jgi:hypothetical protein